MKKLKRGMWVLIHARDWEGDPSWQSPKERQTPAPLGVIGGCVDGQDDTTLYLSSSYFPNDPEDRRDSIKIPTGCIEVVYEQVTRLEPIWKRVKPKGRR